jgi:excisionase family DNA binding protein
MTEGKAKDDLLKHKVLFKHEAAELLRVSQRKIDYMIEEGRIVPIKLGERSVRIPANQIKKILNGQN